MRLSRTFLLFLVTVLIAGREPVAERVAAESGELWASREIGTPPSPTLLQAPRTEVVNTSDHWKPLGPAPLQSPGSTFATTGRVTAIAISPVNPRLILVGAASGGIWRTTNGGAMFTPVIDDQNDLTVGAIAFAPSNPNVVYAGMGDDHLGTGVMRSSDGGVTWRLVSGPPFPVRSSTRKVVVDPSDENVVWLLQASMLNPAGVNTVSESLLKSVDGGATWSAVFNGLVSDFLIPSSNGSTVLLGAVRAERFGTGGVYRTTNGGATWTRMYSGPEDQDSPPMYYLAAAPSGSLYLAAIESVDDDTTYRLLSSSDGGATWMPHSNLPGDFRSIYLNVLAVGPDDRTIFYGAVDAHRSTDGGVTWATITTHPDQHALAFEPGDRSHVWLGNDGGLFHSTDNGVRFDSLAARLPIVQFYSVNASPTDPQMLFGGTQDNGLGRRSGDTTTWAGLIGSDLAAQVFDPHDPARLLIGGFGALIIRCTQNCDHLDTVAQASTFGESNINPRHAFIPPLAEGSDGTVWFATWRIFSSTDFGTTWTATSGTTDLTAGGKDVVTAIGIAPSDGHVLYTGSGKGRVMVTHDGAATWTDITPPVGMPVAAITVSRSSPATAYVAYGGYSGPRIYETTDYGATWIDMSAGLPPAPANTVYVDRNHADRLFAGADGGAFLFDAEAGQWTAFNAGLPAVPVMSFTTTADGRLIAGTYGRGAYVLEESEPATPRKRAVRH
ncbi:MAG TPA: hypothetical protein VGJ81_09795 [Thermoanaerobaculia bacterium]|jgi:photosystem II stability/assembly factor-like uncharacterized protein